MQIDTSEINVSCGKDIKDVKKLEVWSLAKIVERIKCDPDLEEQILEIRATPDKKERNKLKNKLPYFCPGEFENRENIYFQKAEFLLFDFDQVPSVEKLKETIKEDAYITFLSPSGTGIKALYWLTEPIIDVNQYYATYLHYIEQLKNRYGLYPDKQTCDPSRATGLSHDPDISVNESPKMLLKPQDVQKWVKKEIQNYQDVPHFLSELIEYIRPYMTDYNTWFRVGMALASLGEKGRPYFVELSRDNPNYRDTEIDVNRKFDSFLRDHGKAGFDVENGRLLTLPYVLSFAKKNGYKLPAKTKGGEFSLAESYFDQLYEFNYNILEQKLFLREKNKGQQFREMEDRDMNSLYKRYLIDGGSISFVNFKILLGSDYIPVVDPITEFFSSLSGKWQEGDHDYIMDLALTVATRDMKNWVESLRKWLVATVACGLSPVESNHTVLILHGEQGEGKSKWFEHLLPDRMSRYIFTGTIHHKEKDSRITIHRNFIINLDELEGFGKEDISYLKSLITTKKTEIRNPYGHFERKTIRRSSFCGSVNKTSFIKDLTGTRRFLIFTADQIDYMHKIDLEGVWAQALCLFKSGYRYWLDREEIKDLDKRNDEYVEVSMEEELLMGKYRPSMYDKNHLLTIKKTSTEIMQELKADANPSNVQKLGSVLAKRKFDFSIERRGNSSAAKLWLLQLVSNNVQEDLI